MLIGAIDVGSYLEQVDQHVGNVAGHGATDVRDAEVDVLSCALNIEFEMSCLNVPPGDTPPQANSTGVTAALP